jgi:tetratricopeptide (TPR) repeat protein
MKKILILLLPISLFASAQMTEDVMQIQKQWAIVNYQIADEDERVDAFEKLAKSATQVVLNNANNAEALVWEGIVYSTYAGAVSKLSAGSKAKHAKKSFEAAMDIDGSALSGSAYTSIGVLYYKVPGWPFSFGSDKKAEKNLKKGLKFNPDGIDSNYFYAEFLIEEKDDYVKAKEHLLKAQNAKPRATRPVADAGRQKEITKLLIKVEEELAD